VTVIRSTTVLLPVFAGIGLVPARGWKKAVIGLILMLLAQFLVLSPLIYRNYSHFNKFMITRGTFWHTIWVGLEDLEAPLSTGLSDGDAVEFAKKIDPRSKNDPILYEQILKQDVIRRVKNDPLLLLKQWIRRFLQLYSFSLKLMVPLTFLCLPGGIFVLKKKVIPSRVFFFFCMLSLYFFAVIMSAFIPYLHYLLPGFPFLLCLCAAGIVSTWEYCLGLFKKIL
ncbi:MAG: hypothetical protein J7M18_02725, partial [Candidatus Eremiobacteraeota bacterium]|nr:hypothetical protein [Candidatus Eremiobacteraeota bacterium]